VAVELDEGGIEQNLHRVNSTTGKIQNRLRFLGEILPVIPALFDTRDNYPAG
jgi:hypothetical protein